MLIKSISVNNFKACQQLVFEPGRFNVIIGSNGSGKSSLLEAIGVISAAMTDRVNNTTLVDRGIRLSTNSLYQSNFKDERRAPTINFELVWKDNSFNIDEVYTYKVSLNAPNKDNAWRYNTEVLLKGNEKMYGQSGASNMDKNQYVSGLMLKNDPNIQQIKLSLMKLNRYGIFQPNTPTLRGTSSDPYQTEPIGLGGGRLAEALNDILVAGNGEMFGSLYIDDVLELIGWAKEFKITTPKKTNINASVSAARRVIEFSDKYMKSEKKFTAYDASEGALYVLLLLSLAAHERTPAIFAVDNFDHAMNPRLAKVTTRMFSKMILETDKTVFLTTHNPLVLDGLDIQNDDIRLFTMDRLKDGQVKLRRIQVDKTLIDENQPLSRLWVNGRLGGVPELL